ncbi:MAG: MgtC/SapB family protein [Chloroflexi bacterium]|nr:MAG: MgtC/SapB family protein [Chloroflexota bacterium]
MLPSGGVTAATGRVEGRDTAPVAGTRPRGPQPRLRNDNEHASPDAARQPARPPNAEVVVTTDFALQVDLSVRLLIAAALGALIGVEREIHGHPAGMRTHLLVALGSAIFKPTTTAAIDPSRVAAQIVSGIGFLGAGAIIKDGASIRGLTTAASLWATAAIGLAAGAGEYVIGLTGSVIVVFSLWPLNRIAERLHRADRLTMRLNLVVDRLDALAEISVVLARNRLELVGVQSERLETTKYAVGFEIRQRPGSNLVEAIEQTSRVTGVEVVGTDAEE